MNSGALAQRMRETADLLDAFAPTTDTLRALQRAKNAIEAAEARLVAEMAEHLDHESDGYSSPKAWLRDQLRVDTSQASELITAADTLRDLPDLDDAATTGDVSLGHVRLFSYAIKHIGRDETAAATEHLLPVARTHPPAELRQVVKRLREAVYPDDLEQAWIDGMATQDIRLHPVPEGFHLTGFVSNETGVKLKTLLRSLGNPRVAGDDRDTAERRMAGLDALLDAVLANGLPTDNGVRPHITITVDLADLGANPDTTTAEMAGFGTISNAQLKRMLEIGDLTPILTGGPSGVLDVGRTHRLATDKQKRAIDLLQKGRCGTEGCAVPIDDYHHIVRWADGGLTDLSVLTGRCRRCHIEIHQGLLRIDPVTRATRRVLRQVRRRRAA